VSESEFYSAGAPGGGAATANRYRYVYGAGQYDALGRLLGATYQGWTGSWSSTLAHNLTGITYDPSGNLTAMRRYRQDATLAARWTRQQAGAVRRRMRLRTAHNLKPSMSQFVGNISTRLTLP
jgi:YD repeat-containing protein